MNIKGFLLILIPLIIITGCVEENQKYKNVSDTGNEINTGKIEDENVSQVKEIVSTMPAVWVMGI